VPQEQPPLSGDPPGMTHGLMATSGIIGTLAERIG
jgi:hypothetical protein